MAGGKENQPAAAATSRFGFQAAGTKAKPGTDILHAWRLAQL